MEGGICKMPGLLQPRPGFCCLACSLKNINVPEDFVRNLISHHVSVEQILKGSDGNVKAMMDKISPKARRSIIAACDTLIDLHGTLDAYIVHSQYFQRATLPLAFSYLNYKFPIGEIKRGQVLEIFQPCKSSFFGTNVLIALQQESMISDKRPYADVPGYEYNQCVWISTKNKIVTVTAPNDNETEGERFFVYSGTNNLANLFQELHDILILMDSISCIIVDSITSDLPNPNSLYNQTAQQWINFFNWMYGSTSELVLVFTINFDDYSAKGIISKKKVKEMVNADVEQDMQKHIKCLDVSSNQDCLPEREGNVLLELFDLPDVVQDL